MLCIGLYFSANAQKKWSLQECVDYAMKNNLQVIQNQYSKELQDKNYAIAKRASLPTVTGSISNNANFGQQISQQGLINRTDNFNNSAFVGANVLIYNNRRIEKQARKAAYDVEASVHDVETIQNNIALQIAQQYLNVLLNKEIVKINKSALDNAQENFEKTKKTTEVGTTARTVEFEAASTLAQEKQNYQNAQIEVQRSLFSLAQLLQLPDYRQFDVQSYNPTAIDAPFTAGNDIVEEAYKTQPEIKAANSRILSAEEQIEVSKTNYWPTVSAMAGIGSSYFRALHNTSFTTTDPNGNTVTESFSQPGFFKQYKDNFSQQLGLSVNVPIFNQGVTKLQVEQAKINELLAKNNLDQQKQTVKQNVQTAAFDVQANYDKYIAAVEAEKSTKLALDFAQKSFDAGKSTIYDLSIARNNYVNAQGSVLQAKYNYIFSDKLLKFYAGIPLSL